ncbi:hypothetical protein LDENG_00050750 [Lucifuga dentata]|nr:hypothetical protein LDENG_00050750 [Lucifuga dentata]
MCSGSFPVQCLHGLGVGKGCGISSDLGAFIGGERFTDLDFADFAVIFAESMDVLVGALEKLSEELECRVCGCPGSRLRSRLSMTSWSKPSTVYLFVEQFTYLSSGIHVSGSSSYGVERHLGQACGVMGSLERGVWHCQYLCKKTKVQVFRVLVLPVLLYGCETWMLTSDLR